MPNAVWNITIPHSSPSIYYQYFVRDCPIDNGIAQCHDVNSSHVVNNDSSTKYFDVSFYGTAIYLYGEANDGVEYTVSIDGGDRVKGTPQGGLLFTANNLPNKPNSYTRFHKAELQAKRFTNDGTLKFTKAVISVDSGQKTINAVRKTFKIDDPAYQFSAGWTNNDVYKQSNTDYDQSMKFNFTGSTVLAYGLCSNTRDSSTYSDSYGDFLTDTMSYQDDISDSTSTYQVENKQYVTKDCLLFWDTSFTEGKHNVTMTTNKYQVSVSHMDVITLGVNGTDSSVSSNGNSNSTSSSTNWGILGGIIAASVVGLVILYYVVRNMWRRCTYRYPATPAPLIINNQSTHIMQQQYGLSAQVSHAGYAIPQQPYHAHVAPIAGAYDPNKFYVANDRTPVPAHSREREPQTNYQGSPAIIEPHAVPPVPRPPQLYLTQATYSHPVAPGYNPFGIDRHTPAHTVSMSSHSQSPLLPSVNSPVPSVINSPPPAPSSVSGSLSTRPSSISEDTTSATNAAHFAGRTVLAADGSHSYIATKQQTHAGAVSRPAETSSSTASSAHANPPQQYGQYTSGQRQQSRRQSTTASSPILDTRQSQYAQDHHSRAEPASVGQPDSSASHPARRQPGHDLQRSADLDGVPDVPPPMYEETDRR
ncbi:hypothetical protein BKA62DRAFT_696481 [Auriculariales sp. MPI-PUGE-AT-0066]|nr:hypothetical protein BKA62DRAFT_696481 [Auriculariales sp. MPI-PUGE-AT-0066]